MTDGSYRQELAAWGRAVGLTADGAKIDGGVEALDGDARDSVPASAPVAPREGER